MGSKGGSSDLEMALPQFEYFSNCLQGHLSTLTKNPFSKHSNLYCLCIMSVFQRDKDSDM